MSQGIQGFYFARKDNPMNKTEEAAFLQLLSDRAIRGTYAADGLRIALLRLQHLTDAGRAVLAKYNASPDSFPDCIRALRASKAAVPLMEFVGDLSTLFGEQALSVIMALIQAPSEALPA
jgi:hypothetical protein